MRVEINYGEWVLENQCSKAYKAIYTLVRLHYNCCPGYKTKTLCEAAGITPNNFPREFKKHIEYGTLKKINGLWYINPGHIFCGDAGREAWYQEQFNLDNLTEPTVEDLKRKEQQRKLKEAETKANKDKLIEELKQEIAQLKQEKLKQYTSSEERLASILKM